ncbi:substrate-binding domain-containing protein, partial [Flavobacteriaceae bacterium]|nr:substrate-binding domain-containing protein [Flavobacteriaceae bacterium]
AIIGFTNDHIFKHIKPSITSMDQRGEYSGKLSAKLLIDRIQNKTELKKGFRDEKIPFSLIQRESS